MVMAGPHAPRTEKAAGRNVTPADSIAGRGVLLDFGLVTKLAEIVTPTF